jgi:hypothetical protein
VLRRVAVPAAAGAVLLAAAVAMAAAGPAAVAGSPTAGVAASGKRIVADAEPAPKPAPTSTPSAPAPPPPATGQQPEQQQQPPEEPAATQPVNSVRLARGGTATLVPMEVVNGVLPVPEGVREAAWWGAALDGPGGATVLAGHVNWRGATGPFAELWQSKLGDTVTVIAPDGRSFHFRVNQLVTVHKNDLPARAQELFGQDGAHRLVLVTCGGRWVGGHDGYEENRVVVAEPV